jgi:dihydroorotate dehydrogenase electron transfer subunit
MIWLPGVGEFPMSLSVPSENKKGEVMMASIGVKAMGKGSKMLYEAKVGDLIGVRGPYGKGFDIEYFSPSSSSPKRTTKKKQNFLMVGGGTGMVPLLVLAEALSKRGKKSLNTTMIIGAKTKEELPFLEVSKRILGATNVFPTTDDGSFGFKGLAHEQAQILVAKHRFDGIFSCGPEKMMLEIFKIAESAKIPVQFSLERIMKCGIGICGSCTIGDLILCKDGPILNETQISRLTGEFGRFYRDKAGKLSLI